VCLPERYVLAIVRYLIKPSTYSSLHKCLYRLEVAARFFNMVVTEFAVFPLARSVTRGNPVLPDVLIENLKQAKAALESVSGYGFRYFQQIEDPSTIYITGLWDSVAAHDTFLASPKNKELLELFKDDLSWVGDRMLTLWHLEGDVFNLDPSNGLKSVFTAPIISCNRHFVPREKKEGFVSKFEEVRGILEDYTKPFKVIGGWRIEKEEVDGREREEWALFSGFDSVDHHMAFAKTEVFQRYREIVAFVEGFEVKHFKAIESLQ
jgi:heme-degrading monooxygenase HmoA